MNLTAVLIVGAAYAGATSGSVTVTALCVVSVRVLVAMVTHTFACKLVSLSPVTLLSRATAPLLTPAACAVISLVASFNQHDPWTRLLLSGILYGVLLLLAGLTYLREPLAELSAYCFPPAESRS